jgi:glycosyltransferase involved in cell wall biosynthesis
MMMKKKVLFVVSQPYFQWRGSPIRVGFDVQALAELGYQVDLLVPPFGEDRPIPDVTVHRVRNLPGVRGLAIGPSIPKLFFDVLLYFRGRQLMRTNQYAVLHGVEDAGAVCALLARRKGARFVFEKHSDPSSYRKGLLRNVVMAAYACVERWMIRRADAVIGTGPQLAAYAAGVAPGKMAVEIPDIPSSLAESTPEMAAAARQKFVKDPADVLVTYVGSFAVYQGIDLLFASIPLVCRAEPHARFLIVGGSDDEIAARKAEMQAAGVLGQVVFAGKIAPNDLPSVLAGSDILLSPRIAGANTPLKLLDYLKAGRAIVATDHPSNRQILDDRTALFADAVAESYAPAILRLCNDVAFRTALAKGGKSLIENTYNFAAFKHGLGALYKRVENL